MRFLVETNCDIRFEFYRAVNLVLGKVSLTLLRNPLTAHRFDIREVW